MLDFGLMEKMKEVYHDPVLVRAQIVFNDSAAGLETAKEIIKTKIKNSRLLLTVYARSRRRTGSDQASIIQTIVGEMWRWEQLVVGAETKARTFQLEALAAKDYWEAVRVICYQVEDWHRVYPHATDVLSILLNTGYVALGRKVKKILLESGLLLEFGILHGKNSRLPLIYDVMEIFRQPAVDAVIMPIFSRRPKSGVEKGSREFRKAIALMIERWQERFLYNGRKETMERILFLEICQLKRAIVEERPWKPILTSVS